MDVDFEAYLTGMVLIIFDIVPVRTTRELA